MLWSYNNQFLRSRKSWGGINNCHHYHWHRCRHNHNCCYDHVFINFFSPRKVEVDRSLLNHQLNCHYQHCSQYHYHLRFGRVQHMLSKVWSFTSNDKCWSIYVGVVQQRWDFPHSSLEENAWHQPMWLGRDLPFLRLPEEENIVKNNQIFDINLCGLVNTYHF